MKSGNGGQFLALGAEGLDFGLAITGADGGGADFTALVPLDHGRPADPESLHLALAFGVVCIPAIAFYRALQEIVPRITPCDEIVPARGVLLRTSCDGAPLRRSGLLAGACNPRSVFL